MANSTEKIAILGAGTMGAGIAQVAAQAGFQTLLYDIKQEFIDVGMGKIKSFLQGSRERGKISAEQEEEILDRFHTSTSLDDTKGSALVIEAAPEKLELKRDIFKQLDAICGAGDFAGDQYFIVQRHRHRRRDTAPGARARTAFFQSAAAHGLGRSHPGRPHQ